MRERLFVLVGLPPVVVGLQWCCLRGGGLECDLEGLSLYLGVWVGVGVNLQHLECGRREEVSSVVRSNRFLLARSAARAGSSPCYQYSLQDPATLYSSSPPPSL